MENNIGLIENYATKSTKKQKFAKKKKDNKNNFYKKFIKKGGEK